MLARLPTPRTGGFFYTAIDHEAAIARKKDMLDTPVPSGNGLAATALLRLGKSAAAADFLDSARRAMEACLEIMKKHPALPGSC